PPGGSDAAARRPRSPHTSGTWPLAPSAYEHIRHITEEEEMARTTAAQFARQLRRLGATVTVRDEHDVVARYKGVEVVARFSPDADAFDVAWRCNTPNEPAPIRSMAAVRRTLGLPKQPIVVIGQTGRRNSRTHILRQGWRSIAECGVFLPGPATEGSLRDVTCPRCRSIWRHR